jgi:hypothetical protein
MLIRLPMAMRNAAFFAHFASEKSIMQKIVAFRSLCGHYATYYLHHMCVLIVLIGCMSIITVSA